MTEFDLQEEVQALTDLDSYPIENPSDVDSPDFESILDDAVQQVAGSSDEIFSVLDVFRSVLKKPEDVDISIMSRVLDSLTSGLSAELEATLADEQEDSEVLLRHRRNLEIYVFLISWYVTAADKCKSVTGDETGTKKKARGGKAKAPVKSKKGGSKASWTWIEAVPGTLKALGQAMNKLHRVALKMWTTPERETFVLCATKPAYHIMKNEVFMKSQDVKKSVFYLICYAIKHQAHVGHALGNILQLMQYHEHLSDPVAELVGILIQDDQFDHEQLGNDLIQDISTKHFAPNDQKSTKSFARFIVALGEKVPMLVKKRIVLIMNQLDSESYPMRIAVIECIGHLIRNMASNEAMSAADATQSTGTIRNLYKALFDHTLDLSSYVRSKVLVTLAALCREVETKFPKERLKMAQASGFLLEDKVASVRKNAIALLNTLVRTHPYVTHDGPLERDVWQRDYEEVVKEIEQLQPQLGDALNRQDDEADSDKEQEDEMEVDKEDGSGDETDKEEEGEDGNADELEGEGEQMDVDGEERTPSPSKKKTKKEKRPKKLARRSTMNPEQFAAEQATVAALDSDKLTAVRLRRKYISEAIQFITYIEKAVPQIVLLLGSTNKTEVLEAMEFFSTLEEYKMQGSEDGIRRMLHLIWTKDNAAISTGAGDGKDTEKESEGRGVRARLLECYRTMYFEPIAGLDPKGQVNRIAKNMVERTYEATLAELTSLEEMMRILMDDGYVRDEVVGKLWQIYSSSRPLPKLQRRGAIMILGMFGLARPHAVLGGDRVGVMLKVMSTWGKDDLTLAKYTCVALQRLGGGSVKKVKGSLEDKTRRFPMDNPIFSHLQTILLSTSRSKEWFGLAEQAVNTIYALGEHPEELCEDVMRTLTKRAFTRKEPLDVKPNDVEMKEKEDKEDDEEDKMDEDESSTPAPPARDGSVLDENLLSQAPAAASQAKADAESSNSSNDLGDPFELAQLLFVVGHVALKQLVFLELIEREWKRQKDAQTAELKKNEKDKKDKEGEDLDAVVGNAEDEIGDRMHAVRESELLFGDKSLLALYGPMLVHICGSPQIYKDKILRAAATLSFSKFLCLSAQFTDQNYRLLFKLLEKSRDANIRSNIVIALGDVAVSFSTIIDEDSDELYRGLNDPDPHVKKNSLMVLTHLILNGMIKVKGQLGELAKCLQDPDQRISDLAKLFFTEFSTKDNAIYNNLPDVISHLSIGEHAVDEDTFQETLKYIFQFIEKERQAENIVEKLCQRFKTAEEPRQWRDIAFCLSLLPFKSERSVKKLIEGVPTYRDKLHEPSVYSRMQEILSKARQNKSPNKPETELNEFEQALNEGREQGEEDQAIAKRVEGKKAAAARKKGGRTGTRGGREKAAPKLQELEEDEDE